jgi:hypothetical protein
LTVEVGVQSSAPRFVECRELAVFDERSNTSLTGQRANFLVVISLIAKKNRYFSGVSLDE